LNKLFHNLIKTLMEQIKISNVFIEPINIELDNPFIISAGKKDRIENALITVVLNNGIEGYGEAAPLEPLNGENQATVIATLNSCKVFLIGKNISEYLRISKAIKDIFWAQATARCAIEMALLDAYCKTLNIPLKNLFGGAVGQIETDYTIDMTSAATAKEKSIQLAKSGYRVLKTKVGKNLTEDIDRILAIKDGAPDCSLILDANQGFSPTGAVYFMEELTKNNIRPILFEQPVLKTDLLGMRYVKDHISVPVAADESVSTCSDAINIVRTACADVINIKIMKSGILEAFDIAIIARSANIKLMIGSMLETKLALGCSVHLASGIGGFDFIDLDPHIDPAREPFSGGPDYNEPVYSVSDLCPGIGIKKI